MKKEEFIFRQAMLKDVEQMLNFINRNAKKGTMLPKSKKQILDMLFNYLVAVAGGKIVGTCGFKIWADEGVEIISLATLTRFQHQGVGTRLIKANLEKCKDLGFKWFFAMTVAVDMFLGVGFKKTDYQNLPLKIWVDCAACSRNAADPGDKLCNEEAVELLLD